MNSGIYAIVCTTTGRRYIGSAVDFCARFSLHKHQLRRGVHHSRFLQRSWHKYGEAGFKFEKLIICAPEHLLFYEQRAIDVYKPEFNMSPTAGSTLGLKHSAESRAKNSERCKLVRGAPEWKAAQSEKLKRAYAEGRANSDGLRAYVAQASREELQKKYTSEVRDKLREKAKSRAEKYLVNGEMLSVLEAAERYGYAKALLKSRLKRGFSLEQAVSEPVESKHRAQGLPVYPYWDAVLNMAQVAALAGVGRPTVYRWLKAGYSAQEVISGDARQREHK